MALTFICSLVSTARPCFSLKFPPIGAWPDIQADGQRLIFRQTDNLFTVYEQKMSKYTFRISVVLLLSCLVSVLPLLIYDKLLQNA